MKTKNIFYHGSDTHFKNFSFDKMGQSNGVYGAGFGLYFTESKSEAVSYGKWIYECELNLSPVYLSNENLSFFGDTFNLRNFLEQIVVACTNKYGGASIDMVFNILKEFQKDQEKITKLIQTLFFKDTEIFPLMNEFNIKLDICFEAINKLGVNHNLDLTSSDSGEAKHVIMFNTSDIKILSVNSLDSLSTVK